MKEIVPDKGTEDSREKYSKTYFGLKQKIWFKIDRMK